MQVGADVNTCNSHGYTPMLEVCHRGYANIVKSLLDSGKVDLAYMPPPESTNRSPFTSAPPQSALGEAARAGSVKIIEVITVWFPQYELYHLCIASELCYIPQFRCKPGVASVSILCTSQGGIYGVCLSLRCFWRLVLP